MNGDGMVDEIDLAIFSDTFLLRDYQTVDWCEFYQDSMADEKYFRSFTSDNTDRYQQLFDFIVVTYECEAGTASASKSDLSGDGVVDLADLALFSEAYLGRNWETVDWCLFYEATLAGEDFEGQSTRYYLKHFEDLLVFINTHFNCNAPPPSSKLVLENAPKYLVRIADAPLLTSDLYITDPLVGSLFIYGENLTPTGELKGLSRPLGVAFDSQGHILVGNDGRNNVEAYDPATGNLVAVFGEGLLSMPTAITVDMLGDIYVTDAKNDTVLVFSPSYVFLRSIGRGGQGPGGLDFPVDTVVTVQQEVFVADQGNDRIQVYALDGTWLRSITFEGTAGQNCNWFTGVCEIPGAPPFQRLKALDLDSIGRLHVLDSFGAAVIMLDPADGAYLGMYGQYGEEPGTLRVPMDVLAADSGDSFVTSGDGARIELFANP